MSSVLGSHHEGSFSSVVLNALRDEYRKEVSGGEGIVVWDYSTMNDYVAAVLKKNFNRGNISYAVRKLRTYGYIDTTGGSNIKTFTLSKRERNEIEINLPDEYKAKLPPLQMPEPKKIEPVDVPNTSVASPKVPEIDGRNFYTAAEYYKAKYEAYKEGVRDGLRATGNWRDE